MTLEDLLCFKPRHGRSTVVFMFPWKQWNAITLMTNKTTKLKCFYFFIALKWELHPVNVFLKQIVWVKYYNNCLFFKVVQPVVLRTDHQGETEFSEASFCVSHCFTAKIQHLFIRCLCLSELQLSEWILQIWNRRRRDGSVIWTVYSRDVK